MFLCKLRHHFLEFLYLIFIHSIQFPGIFPPSPLARKSEFLAPCLTTGKYLFISCVQLSEDRKKKKICIEDVAHTLQRICLKREMLSPSEFQTCPQIPLHHLHGAAAIGGDPVGKWVSPFSLSLLFSTPQVRMAVFPWNSLSVLVWSIISGPMLP